MSIESTEERLDREQQELFGELRAVIPGAQVVFAFLLGAAFSDRFTELSDGDQLVYLLTFMTTALSLVLLLAPTVFHRTRFRQRDKEAMMRLANAETLVAMFLIAVSVACSVYLISSFVTSRLVAGLTAAGLFAVTVGIWWAIPLDRRARRADEPGPPPAASSGGDAPRG